VERRLAELDGAHGARRDDALRRLTAHHDTQTHNFQHERLIHLLVTFFFGALLIAALVGVGLYLAAGDSDPWTTAGLAALCVVLAGLEIAYIGHYYKLENNVQALYGLTARLFQASIRAQDVDDAADGPDDHGRP
jgi:hypothetical protein